MVVKASTLPMAARSTGTSRSATFVVTTGTAAPPSPRPLPPRPPPPPVPAAEPEQPAATTRRRRPETNEHAGFDNVMNSRKRDTETLWNTHREGRTFTLQLIPADSSVTTETQEFSLY